MSGPRKTALVTGASQGIGAGIVKAFVERGFNVVATSRKMTESTEVTDPIMSLWWTATSASRHGRQGRRDGSVALPVDRRTGQQRRHLLHQALHGLHGRGLQVARLDEPRGLPVRHAARRQANVGAEDRREHRHDHGGAARNPIRGVTAAVPMITKGGLKRSPSTWRWSTRKTASV